MAYIFGIGDLVEVIKSGSGASPDDVGKEVTITGFGAYNYLSDADPEKNPGYTVTPKIGNCLTGQYNGVIEEASFKLLRPKKRIRKRSKFVKKKATIEIGDYIRYKGTKKHDGLWYAYFGSYGVVAGDVGIVENIDENGFFVKDEIRRFTGGVLVADDVEIISEQDYYRDCRVTPVSYEEKSKSQQAEYFPSEDDTSLDELLNDL